MGVYAHTGRVGQSGRMGRVGSALRKNALSYSCVRFLRSQQTNINIIANNVKRVSGLGLVAPAVEDSAGLHGCF